MVTLKRKKMYYVPYATRESENRMGQVLLMCTRSVSTVQRTVYKTHTHISEARNKARFFPPISISTCLRYQNPKVSSRDNLHGVKQRKECSLAFRSIGAFPVPSFMANACSTKE